MTTFAIAVALFAQAEIEVPSTVAPLSRLLPQLSQASGTKLIPDPKVKDDVVGIASPKRPVRELMDGIAAAINGTWEERKEGWVLTRTKAQELEDGRKEVALRTSWIRAALAKTKLDEPFDEVHAKALAGYRYEFKSKERTGAEYGQLDVMNSRSPMGRLTRRLVEAIGVERLAEIPTGKRTVFSTRPTKMQIPLPVKDISKVIDRFKAEQNLYAAAVKAKGEPTTGPQTTYVSGFDHVQEIPLEWDRILVIVGTGNPYQTFLVVNLVDKTGKVTGAIRCYINRNDFIDPSTIEPNTPPIPLSPETQQIVKALVGQKELTDKQREPFSDPAAREPLAFLNTEALATWSAFAKKPVIALFNDQQLANVYGITDPYPLAQYRRGQQFQSTITETDRWVLLQPDEPVSTRMARANRPALSAYFASYLKNGFATLESQVMLTGSVNSLSGHGLPWFVQYGLPGQPSLSGNQGLLHLISLATPAQQKAFLAGAEMTLGEMNPAQKAWATDLVFNNDNGEGIAVNRKLMIEITELYANGLPAATLFKTDLSDEQAIRFKAHDRTLFEGPEGAAQYWLQQETKPSEFQYGRLRVLKASFTLEPVIAFSGNYKEEQVDKAGPWKTYADLPEDFRKRLDDALAALRKKYNIPPPLN